jgi:dipeptidyl aminopeptidase/acylaminoacyl peptidase
MRFVFSVAALVVLAPLSSPAQNSAPAAAGKKVLSIDDYPRWRTIDNAALSPDGKWAAYGLRFSNTAMPDAKPVLHLRNLATNSEVEIADASQPSFSPDSRWITYQVDPPPPTRAGRRGGAPDSVTTTTTVTTVTTTTPANAPPPATPPVVPSTTTTGRGAGVPPVLPRRWELRELATGKTQTWQEIQSAVFSPSSSHLLLRRRPPTGAPGANAAANAPGAAAPANPAAPRGVDMILHDLGSGHSQFLGSVGESAFNRNGELLAYTVDAAVRDGNGLFVIELKSDRTDVLDNDSLRYSRLAWNDRGTGIAVLKGREAEKMRERQNELIVFTDIAAAERAPVVLDPVTAAGFPKGFMLSDRAPLAWSDDGHRVFVSIIPQTAAPDTARRKSADSVADVDVWRTQDERIQSVQMIQAESDRNRTFREGFDLVAAKYIPLSDSTMRELELPGTGQWAVGLDRRAYVSDYKHPAADFYRVNTLTGERTKMLTGQLTGAQDVGISPDDRDFLYWNDGNWQLYDLAAGTTHTLASPAGVSFADMEEDHPGPRPPYSVAGYASDGSGVIVNHRFDVWFLPRASTGAPKNLTGGAGTRDRIVYRYVRTEPIDSSVKRASQVAREIDLSKPITLSTYGEYTKKAGFSRLADDKLQSLVYDDAAFSTPFRAAHGDRYLYTRQTFSEFPDLLVAGADLSSPAKISNANPQQADFLWGHRVLFDFVTKRGDKLQGILALPDDYQPGQKRPMLVTFYEKNSQSMHRYTAPSYITGMGTMPIEAVSRGYITMIPDVAFHTGSSHSDMLDAVESATKKVIAMGYVDPAKIGVHGHSYGGEGAAFIGTRSRLFAAVGVGAGVTDLFTDFSQSWGWSYQVATGGSGANGNDYYLYGQGRWGFSPWERPDVYHFESALSHVPEVTAPILIMHGTADPTVSFSEGMNFYNALRYNGKNATMLAYTNEGHGLRGLANRKDLTIRYFQFFDHYLKGAPAPKWMSDGVAYIARDAATAPQ